MHPPAALFGFDLLSPSMLGWLAAAAAPLLIHLWSRRRYQETAWAAMQYLLAAMKAARRRTRLEQWLLLLIRTSIIVAVVLAAAEPYAELGAVSFAPGIRTHRVFVVDSSYSMDYVPEDVSRFEAAKELAVRIVDESQQGDGFSLVRMADPAKVVVDEPSLARPEFIVELQALRLSHGGADLAGAVAHVERLLADTGRRHPKLTRREVYFLTDLGKTTWDVQQLGRTAAEQIRRRLLEIGATASLILIDLGREDAGNVAVTGLFADQALITRGRGLTIRGELRNFGRSPVTQKVQLLADGHRVGEQSVRLEGGGQATVTFSHRTDTIGKQVLGLSAPGDRLEVDNNRFLAVEVRPAVRVLCVDGQPAGGSGAATEYLVHALAPDRRGVAAVVQPEVVAESALLELDLHQYDCVMLVNLAQFTGSEARVLDNYLKAGGGIVFFLGDRVLPEQYNRALGGGSPEQVDLLPARLAGQPVEQRQTINPLEYRHPIVEVFRGQERAGLLGTPVHKYFPLELPDDSRSRTVLALDDGTALIVERPVHRGRVILVGTSADVTWTPMPVLPSYVPIVQEILHFAVADQNRRRNVLVGESIGAVTSRVGPSPSVSIHTPDGRTETAPWSSADGVAGWDFAATDPSGVYTATRNDPPEVLDVFAVNVDTRESDLARISEEELRGVLADVAFQIRSDGHRPAGQAPGVITRSGGLAKTLLYLLLVLLLAETYLARRFGHHAR